MSSIGTLWTVDQQAAGKRIKAIAAYGGLKLDLAQGYTHFETNKTDAFLNKFASGKIPAFEDKDGFTLFESKAIAKYVATLAPNAGLLGSNPKEAAHIDQWVYFADSEISVNLGASIAFCKGFVQPYNKPIETFFRERTLRALATLEKYLSTRTFLVGERISLADITAASILQPAFVNLLDPEYRKKNPNTLRFYETVTNHPAMKGILGGTEYCDKAIQYTPPAKPAKEAKPAPTPAAAPKKAAKKEEEEEEEDDIPKEEPKAKNPLDSLPKSDFNLEDWKRAYSNLDTRGAGGSIEWFDGKFDKEGFSVWRVDFKYNEELTQVFMSSNQIGGFFNRLEASRKYLFGSVGVVGAANNSVISGVFICRGPDIKPVVEVAPDWESYVYTKLDLGNSQDKKFFEGALAWDLEIDSRKWADGKNFK